MLRSHARRGIVFAAAAVTAIAIPIAASAGAQVSRPAARPTEVLTGRLPAGAINAFSSRAPARPFAANVIIPQTRAFAVGRPEVVHITGVDVDVMIAGQTATTTMDIHLQNPCAGWMEAELIVPVPDGAIVRGFAFAGPAQEPVARVLPEDEARRIYDGLVARIRDPALLEFLGYNLVRSSVFPVEAGGTQQVRLIYEHLLPRDGARIDYSLPRTEALDYGVPWSIEVYLRCSQAVSTAYSPSHEIETQRLAAGDIIVRLAPGAGLEPGPFRLSFLLEESAVTASLFAYPDLKGDGGYFLLLAGTPAAADARSTAGNAGNVQTVKREVIIVLDRSGSMGGEKLEQARQAALQVISALEDGETFNLIVYNEGVDLFAPAPVVRGASSLRRAAEYLASLRASGGTNIHEALLVALNQKSTEGKLPIVLFLTDGLPTIGQTSEHVIRTAVRERNPQGRRIFTFGVGVDVNAPLLDAIASGTRARPTYVLPGEDIEVKVARQFQCLAGPILAAPEIHFTGLDGASARSRVRDVIPTPLPDLFAGDQLVLLGRYTGEEPLEFELTGDLLGEPKAFRYCFEMGKASTRNAFVPRLWASRRIAALVDAIRQAGDGRATGHADARPAADPRLRELVDEIIALSTEFGILTEYTAFLAEEGTDLSARNELLARAARNLRQRAVAVRSGKGAVGQSLNIQTQINQKTLNYKNSFVYLDEAPAFEGGGIQRNTPPTSGSSTGRQLPEGVTSVSFGSIQQVNDRTFFKRQGQWVDSRIITNQGVVAPTRTIEFGSGEFHQLALRLVQEGRQGTIALQGDILLEVDGQRILVRAPAGN